MGFNVVPNSFHMTTKETIYRRQLSAYHYTGLRFDGFLTNFVEINSNKEIAFAIFAIFFLFVLI